MKFHHSPWLLCALAATVVACGPASDEVITQGESGQTEQVAQTQEGLSSKINVPPSVKALAGYASDLSSVVGYVKSGIEIAQALGEFFGFLDAKPDPFAALTAELQTGLLNISWQLTLQHADLARSYTNNAITQVRSQALPMDAGSPAGAIIDSNSIMATTLLGVNPSGAPNLQNSAFLRLHNEAATDGPWKQVISARPSTKANPANPSTQLVYDWRMGLPVLMDTVAKRVAIIAASDPGFSTAAHKSELLNMRNTLKAHLNEITVNGLQCNYRFLGGLTPILKPNLPPVIDTRPADRTGAGGGHTAYKAQVACADIYTGTSWFDEWAWPDSDGPCTKCVSSGGRFPTSTCSLDNACVAAIRDPALARVKNAEDAFRRSVLDSMPIFELRSLIDQLYFYANSMLDLTVQFGQVPLSAQPPHLCVDTGGWVQASWEGTPVSVRDCNYSNEQWWQYDRRTGAIKNPVYNVCLEVQPYNDVMFNQLTPGVTVSAATCSTPTQKRQRWTYDHESKLLRNALGTVLDVKNGVLQSGTPLWTADINNTNGASQKWFADQPLTLQVSPPSTCGQIKPNEGLRRGETATSCDGRFSLVFNWDGNLVLQQLGASAPLWQTNTANSIADTLIMQGNGNLVLYDWLGGAVWHSNTPNRDGASLSIQNDGNVVIYNTAYQAVWNTNTCCR